MLPPACCASSRPTRQVPARSRQADRKHRTAPATHHRRRRAKIRSLRTIDRVEGIAHGVGIGCHEGQRHPFCPPHPSAVRDRSPCTAMTCPFGGPARRSSGAGTLPVVPAPTAWIWILASAANVAATRGSMVPLLLEPSVNRMMKEPTRVRLRSGPSALPEGARWRSPAHRQSPFHPRPCRCTGAPSRLRSQSWSNVNGAKVYALPANTTTPMRSFGRLLMKAEITGARLVADSPSHRHA